MHVVYLIAALVFMFVLNLVIQWRIHRRDEEDRALARYALRKTGSTESLTGFAGVVEKRRERSWIMSVWGPPKT